MPMINAVRLLDEGPDYISELVKNLKEEGRTTEAYDWVATTFGAHFANLHFHNWPLQDIKRRGGEHRNEFAILGWLLASNIDRIGKWGISTQGHTFWEALNRIYKGTEDEAHIEVVRSFVCTYP